MIKRFLPVLLVVVGTIVGTKPAFATTPPKQNNAAYVLMDYNTGEILAAKNLDTQLPPASLTKMMTSYILEQKLLDGELTEETPILMSETAWCRGKNSESCMYVPVNTTATALDMLKGIIIQSGNDASQAVAEHISGTEPAFADLMNTYAQKLAMTNTHFVNATGMPAANHYSSARDLAILARAIIQNSQPYYGIYGQKEFTYNNITQGNRNALLLTDPTVDGLKTGQTNEAGYCLAVSAEREHMRLIAIILGAPSMQARADQSRELLAFGYGNFATLMPADKGESIIAAPIKFGKATTVEAIANDALKVLTTKDKQHALTTRTELLPDLAAPITRGQKVGQLVAVMDGQAVASVPLVASEDVAQVNILARLWGTLIDWFGGLF